MADAYVRSRTGVGATSPIYFGSYGPGGTIGWQVVVTGTVTYDVQESNDAVTTAQDGNGGTPTNWFTDAAGSAKSANANSNVTGPCRWMRVNVTAGTGSVTLTAQAQGPTPN